MPTNTKHKPTRRPDGTFPLGTSGNPSGRPKSEAVALRESLATGAEDVVKAILDAAIAGDMQAAKIVMDRLVPPIKASAQPVRLNLPDASTPLDIARAILDATATGTLPPDIAAQLVAATGTFCRIEEMEELRERIKALEKATSQPQKQAP